MDRIKRLRTKSLCLNSPYCGEVSCPKYYSRDDDIDAMRRDIPVSMRDYTDSKVCIAKKRSQEARLMFGYD